MLLPTREAEVKVEHWSGDMKLGVKRADAGAPNAMKFWSSEFQSLLQGPGKQTHTSISHTRHYGISLLMQVTRGFKHRAGVLANHPSLGFTSLTVLPERPTGRILGFVA